MTFASLNYVAILIAAVVAWLAGAAWYMTLGKAWTAALGMTPEQMEAAKRRPGAHLPFIYAFVAELVMAWVLAGLLSHIGAFSLRGGIISGASAGSASCCPPCSSTTFSPSVTGACF
jgi:hypothetical protein